MRITSIDVMGLFGLFDHVIPLGIENRVTIVYGPNGVGKTTILRLVYDLFEKRFERLARTPFQILTVSLEDGSRIIVEKSFQESANPAEQLRRSEPAADLLVLVDLPLAPTRQFVIPRTSGKPKAGFPLSMLEDELPIMRIGGQRWEDISTGEQLSLQQVAARYSDVFPPLQDVLESSIPEELSATLDAVSIHLIETQRLLTLEAMPVRTSARKTRRTASTVVRYSEDLVRVIQRNLASSAKLGQRLDRTFPSRLLQEDTPEISEQEIRQRYSVQSERRERLVNAALLDMGEELPLPDRELNTIERRIMWAYLNDVDQKLAVFDDLLRRIELFKVVINSRFLYKQLSVDNEAGFRVQNEQGQLLAVSDLSSGEQHELVLAYQLLFQVGQGSLVLIDEPEISLHVSWQQNFLDDVVGIAEVGDLYFLIATHSPQIINDRFDLAVSLRGPHDS